MLYLTKILSRFQNQTLKMVLVTMLFCRQNVTNLVSLQFSINLLNGFDLDFASVGFFTNESWFSSDVSWFGETFRLCVMSASLYTSYLYNGQFVKLGGQLI